MEVNVMGMTDLQFKSYVRKLITIVEHAEKSKTPEEMQKELEALKKMLQEDAQG